MSETVEVSPAETKRVQDALRRISDGGRLTRDEAYRLMLAIMSGAADTTQLAGLLMGLRVRGETVDEITGFAQAMREKSLRIAPKVEGRLTDTCGTGGAKTKTFNVSTTSALVASGAGVPIAKHGNRSVTSPSGSADVLEALGADLSKSPEQVERIVETVGIGFLFAPAFHPAMKYAVPARKALGVRTVFNVLGPLTNPAGAAAQVIGVFDEALVEPLAKVLANLGLVEAMVVHGTGGMDEVSTLGPTTVGHVRDGKVEMEQLDITRYGVAKARPEELTGAPPAESARMVHAILSGTPSPRADLVIVNAACAILVGGKAGDYGEALQLARESIDSGAARGRLAAYIAATGGTPT
ncbi:MAG: anthranilate phosphoribosyltransferase [Euryarchaeota archaeon]|nr:anthranilate phosphoribosyltransferase [Euryarchaeota archaeon]